MSLQKASEPYFNKIPRWFVCTLKSRSVALSVEELPCVWIPNRLPRWFWCRWSVVSSYFIKLCPRTQYQNAVHGKHYCKQFEKLKGPESRQYKICMHNSWCSDTQAGSKNKTEDIGRASSTFSSQRAEENVFLIWRGVADWSTSDMKFLDTKTITKKIVWIWHWVLNVFVFNFLNDLNYLPLGQSDAAVRCMIYFVAARSQVRSPTYSQGLWSDNESTSTSGNLEWS